MTQRPPKGADSQKKGANTRDRDAASSEPQGHRGTASSDPQGHRGAASSDPQGHRDARSSHHGAASSDPLDHRDASSSHRGTASSDPQDHHDTASSDPQGHHGAASSDPQDHNGGASNGPPLPPALPSHPQPTGPLQRLIYLLIDLPLLTGVLALLLVGLGLYVSPLGGLPEGVPHNPVPVDALPDVGENQQIVHTRWPGRTPRDVEDQITYPLVTALLGMPGVRTVRSHSAFGSSQIFVIFEDDVEFYWSRTRLTERLVSLPAGTLPEGVRPLLGPDATGLGQIFWYTIEAEEGGFDLADLREVQNFIIGPALRGVPGVAEVAPVGGYVREWQVEVDPQALQLRDLTLEKVAQAIRASNLDVGAGTLELNGVEYTVRGAGRLENLEALGRAVVRTRDGVPITLSDVAHLTEGPAPRRGALDDAGVEAVGGVVVVRHGENPRAVIERVRERLRILAPSLPKITLPNGRESAMQVKPFYDRAELIDATVDNLKETLIAEVLVTVLVVVGLLWSLRTALFISALLPLAVLLSFLGMKLLNINAHLMSLSGIAIAIGTMVDLGIILAENAVRHLRRAPAGADAKAVVKRAVSEVSGAVITAVSTTLISFLPVFALDGSEGKLFGPLAATKTLALVASLLVSVLILPPLLALGMRPGERPRRSWPTVAVFAILSALSLILGPHLWPTIAPWAAAGFGLTALVQAVAPQLRDRAQKQLRNGLNVAFLLAGGVALTLAWRPLGEGHGLTAQLLFTFAITGGVLGIFSLFRFYFRPLLGWALDHRMWVWVVPVVLVLWGLLIWRGAEPFSRWLPEGDLRAEIEAAYPPMPTGFMPPFDEGSFLFMPTTMPHASLAEALDVLQRQDRAISALPEVERVVGKIGQAESALDPAPLSMIETVIQIKPEYGPPDPETGERVRQWRPEVRTQHDVWQAITDAAALPGATGAPYLQPIAARQVMLASGMNAPIGLKMRAGSLQDLEAANSALSAVLMGTPGLDTVTLQPDWVMGSPWLELRYDREALARYGVTIQAVGEALETAVGGTVLTEVINGRARYPVRLRYPRELRDNPEALREIRVPTADGGTIPLGQLAELHFERGPMGLKAEDGFLVGWITFDALPGVTATALVARATALIEQHIESGDIKLPEGTSWWFAGEFEAQKRTEATMMVMVPLSLLLIFAVLYLEFRKLRISLLVFSSIAVAWSGGFIMLQLFSDPSWLQAWPGGQWLSEVFHLGPQPLTIGVWVGFLALFGIAQDDGVIMSTWLEQLYAQRKPSTPAELRALVIDAANRRIRACLMTSATTMLSLLPVLTSDGRGADLMRPLALPTLGGMVLALITLFVVPVGWYALHLPEVRRRAAEGAAA